MTIKEQVLDFLERNKGGHISGNDIAKELYISRNAVWKAVTQLREEGYEIAAITNKGYCLEERNDIISAQSIQKYLNCDDYKIEVYKTVTSTNNILRQKVEEGAGEGFIVVSEEQTEGKGRNGRRFFSPKNTGIYMSILLKPSISAMESLNITTAAAVAVAEVLEQYSGRKMGIKWVNDIFCGDRKVCGILTEASLDFESGGLNYVILGIGINIFVPETSFPEEINSVAASVFNEREESGLRSLIISEIIKKFMNYYGNLGDKKYYEEYKKRSVIIGKEIEIINKNYTEKAIALDIDENFRLKVRKESGKEEFLSSGEVSIRKIQE